MILLIDYEHLEANDMRELVGTCKACQREIYCLDGFLNGVVTNDNEIYCFECIDGASKKEENPQS